MNIARRVFTSAPVTSVFVLSTSAFWLIEVLAPNRAVASVLFYLFALPSYLVSLLGMAISYSLGMPPSRWVAVALCIGVDLILILPLRSLGRAGHHDS